MKLALALVALAGCSNILGIEDLSGPSGTPIDGNEPPADAPDVGELIMLSGTTQLLDPLGNGSQPLVGAPITFFRQQEVESLASSQTEPPNGSFTLDLETREMPVLGFLHVGLTPTAPSYRDHMIYPPQLVQSTEMLAQAFSNQTIDFLQSQTEPNDGLSAFVVVFVLEVGSSLTAPVGRVGVTVSSDAGSRVFYGDGIGAPQPTLNQTSSMGVAYIINDQPAPHRIQALIGATVIGERLIEAQPGTVQVVMLATSPSP